MVIGMLIKLLIQMTWGEIEFTVLFLTVRRRLRLAGLMEREGYGMWLSVLTF